MKSLIVGLDIGTSSVKAGLFDLQGKELAMAQEPLSIDFTAIDQAEQDADKWWIACQKVLNKISQSASPGIIQSIGLSAQCPGHVLVDQHAKPIGPAIIWYDRRAYEEATWLTRHISSKTALEWVGNTSMGDMSSSPARLLWMKKNRQADWKRADKILQPKDFIGLLLTGQAVTDNNTAFLIANPYSKTYHPDFLALLEAEENQLPQVKTPTMILGVISKQASALTGLVEGTPVYTGTIDAYCDILAGGGIKPGHAVDVAGTSEIISLGVTGNREGSGVYYAQIEEEGGFLCGPTQNGCSILKWAIDAFYPEMKGKADYDVLVNEAMKAPPGADGMFFLPYLSGERAPIWDKNVRAAFLGLNNRHQRPHFTRAVYESVGFSIRHVLETCEQVSSQTTKAMVVCGGGSQSPFWNQVKANILQQELLPIQSVNSACLGAAMLAAKGSGHFSSLTIACDEMIHPGKPISPEPEFNEIYNIRYSQYRDAYPSIQNNFQAGKGFSE